MGYYKVSQYRGDYYRPRGDYYGQGDPGFFDDVGGFFSDVVGGIGSVAGKVAGIAAPFLPGPLGAVVGGVGKLLGGGPSARAPVTLGGSLIPAPSLFMPSPYSPPEMAATSPGLSASPAMLPKSPFSVAGPRLLASGGPRGGGGRSGGAGASGTNGGTPTFKLVGYRNQGGQCLPVYSCRPSHTAVRRVDSWEVKGTRRMNPLNPHALRRALRRASGFAHLVSKSVQLVKPGYKLAGFRPKMLKSGRGRKRK